MLNEESEFYTFAGPSGSSDIDLTLGNVHLERSYEWDYSVRPDLGVSDHNPIIIHLRNRSVDGSSREDSGT